MSTKKHGSSDIAEGLYEGKTVAMRGAVLTDEEIASQLYRYEHTAPLLPSLADFHDEQLKLYKRQGYVAVERLLSGETVRSATEALMNLIFEDAKEARIQYTKPKSELHNKEEQELAVRKVHDYVPSDETLTRIAYDPELIAKLRLILGDEPVLAQNMALLKPPHGGGEKPWHQDMAYGPLAYDKPVVGVWIALDEAALDNGCMHVIPRSHMDGGVPHYAVRDWQICDTNVRVEHDVAVPLPPGGALFFHGMLHHGTPPNGSDKRRRALQFHYAGQSSRKVRPDEYKRIYTNEMTDAEC
ncbi:Ectoine hydroxylase-related dioxygenase, phytanoyl-CoA dioxygenase (PhyH) family [Paenibacillus sp. UNCCL117]|uniref:phytanoyl-CoA dioxygenase family protein n=1 Tax=unclassified Paenibacillus TaxID=185978 RepID=UPI0008926FD8|nr:MULTISPECIES: phytanoyl-CoA dioxygenase family protein [unclassified Paenibacillus]SDC28143.1 Ectoine hydroxylase-related dioxygenase, phytanoyl-CoA dioxygenase (PhyH) family [Paenibacillus sp. cl123]SFW20484.1 Ectoine hydroxylase-related dioxygenase, phytanoyl-CoA dioxygenase (PhyH) family [Paenibacillus sp. UNCCL117]